MSWFFHDAWVVSWACLGVEPPNKVFKDGEEEGLVDEEVSGGCGNGGDREEV